MKFDDRLRQRIQTIQSNLCVGLDPRAERIDGPIDEFLIQVVEETAPFAAAFKPNIAYFEPFGAEGFVWLERVVAAIPDDVPVVLDAKRSDIPETMKYYAKAYFDEMDVDAITLNPFCGFDSLEPFLQTEGKGIYVLAVTSNAGARDIELLETGDRRVFQVVQDMHERAADLPGTFGMVMGLTNLTDDLLATVADLPLLIPGLGAQGGSLDALQGVDRQAPLLINSSRSILYGKKGSAGDRAKASMENIRAVLSKP